MALPKINKIETVKDSASRWRPFSISGQASNVFASQQLTLLASVSLPYIARRIKLKDFVLHARVFDGALMVDRGLLNTLGRISVIAPCSFDFASNPVLTDDGSAIVEKIFTDGYSCQPIEILWNIPPGTDGIEIRTDIFLGKAFAGCTGYSYFQMIGEYM